MRAGGEGPANACLCMHVGSQHGDVSAGSEL